MMESAAAYVEENTISIVASDNANIDSDHPTASYVAEASKIMIN